MPGQVAGSKVLLLGSGFGQSTIALDSVLHISTIPNYEEPRIEHND